MEKHQSVLFATADFVIWGIGAAQGLGAAVQHRHSLTATAGDLSGQVGPMLTWVTLPMK